MARDLSGEKLLESARYHSPTHEWGESGIPGVVECSRCGTRLSASPAEDGGTVLKYVDSSFRRRGVWLTPTCENVLEDGVRSVMES